MNLFLRTTALMLLMLSRAPAFAALPGDTPSLSNSKESQNEVCPQKFKHSLTGLYGIEPFSAKVPQPYADFDVLYGKSFQAQSELEMICRQSALHSAAKTEFNGIKSKQRAWEKVQTELNSDPTQITDIARATIIADDIPSLVEAYEVLNREATVVQVKNRFKAPRESGYRDLNVLVQLPKTGIIAEVQLHLSDIANVKSGPEHKIYEQVQKIERVAAAERRNMNEWEMAKVKQLANESKSLYQAAWQPYITTHLAAA